MYLYIDTTDQSIVRLALYDAAGSEVGVTVREAPYKHGEVIHDELTKLLSLHSVELRDIQGVLVNPGPGPFSATRTGVSVANAAAWSLDVPVVAVEDGGIGQMIALFEQGAVEKDKIITPVYAEEPKITQRKT